MRTFYERVNADGLFKVEPAPIGRGPDGRWRWVVTRDGVTMAQGSDAESALVAFVVSGAAVKHRMLVELMHWDEKRL